MAFDKSVLFLCVSVIYFMLLNNDVFARPGMFKEGDIRLIGGRESHKGTVLVYHEEKWGAVCDHRWDVRDAIVVCCQLGYSGAERAAARSEFGRGRRRMWLSHVSCGGYEKRLDECLSRGYGTNNCRGSFHSAGVVCTFSSTTPVSTTEKPSTTTKPTATTEKTTLSLTTSKATTLKLTTGIQATTHPSTTTTTAKSTITTHSAIPVPPAVTPSPWIWDDNSNTWIWKPHNGSATIALEDVNEHNEPEDIFDEILNDEAAIPPEDIDDSEYTAPESLLYHIQNEIELQISEESESLYSDENAFLASELDSLDDVKLIPALTSPLPTTQTPWMWDDTLAQYLLRPQNGRRTESPWIWDHERELYVLRSEHESPHTAEQPPLQYVNVEIEERQYDSVHVRDPLEMHTHDVNVHNDSEIVPQPDAAVSETDGVYEVPFIPEVANPEEYLRGDSVNMEANFEHRENGDNHAHGYEQHNKEQDALPILLQLTHYQGYQIENSHEPADTHIDNVLPSADVLNDNASLPTQSSLYASAERFDNNRLSIQEDPYRKKMVFRVEGGRSQQEGRIEVRPPYQNGWGVICGDMWTLREAIVACREFGLGYAESASKTAHFGGADRDKLFWRVKCFGSESRLEDCAWEDHNGVVRCSRRDSIAGIVCTSALPDLIPNVTAIETSSFLQDRHLYYLQCSMEENCLSSSAYEIMKTPNWMTTTRRLLRFSSIVHNRGTSDFVPFVPRHLWEWHACHMHYHSMEVFARYDIVDDHGNRIAEGLKASFCLEDSACDYGIHPKYNCDGYGHQGIAVGCSDNYLADIDCQWIDMTDVKPGKYTFKLEVNPELRVAEMSFENNVVICTLWYGGNSARLQGCHLESLL